MGLTGNELYIIYHIAKNIGGRKFWQIDHWQKLANNSLANALHYFAHAILL